MNRFPINDDGKPRPRRITGDLDDEAGFDFDEVVKRGPQSSGPDGDGGDEVPADAEPDPVGDDAEGAELSEEAFREQERLGPPADAHEPEQAPNEAQAAPADEAPAAPGRRAKRKRGRNRASPATDETEPPDPASATEDAQAADGNWMSILQLGDKGPKGNDLNASLALENAPELAGKIAFDVRLGALVALRPGPFGPSGKWSSANSAALTIWLQGQGIPVRVSHVETALLKLGQEHQIDPLEDYLLGLQWDGVERIGSWLEVYAGVVATPVSSLIGSKFLIGMVARAFKPGCQMDYALTLEGPQGEGKSSLIRILGGQYGSESLPDFHSRDAQQIAGESWIIEIADLAALGRSAIEQFKSFITTTADSFVPKYERHKVTRKRWCVFVMTVNPNGAGYLFDEDREPPDLARHRWHARPQGPGQRSRPALRRSRILLPARRFLLARKPRTARPARRRTGGADGA
jgi:hypothetical protein